MVTHRHKSPKICAYKKNIIDGLAPRFPQAFLTECQQVGIDKVFLKAYLAVIES